MRRKIATVVIKHIAKTVDLLLLMPKKVLYWELELFYQPVIDYFAPFFVYNSIII
jgi:hypothetical protein